jgi:hypothetical protein
VSLYERPELHTYLDAEVDPHHHRIVRVLTEDLGLQAGDRVLEIGAGSGRYTRVLLDLGLEVIAVEPDPVLSRKLGQNLRSDRLSVAQRAVTELPQVRAICGFHVLHHFDEAALHGLCAAIVGIAGRNPDLRGWFFMEPNPINPLYPVHILLWPGMRFREEKGIWRRDLGGICAAHGVDLRVLGHIGLVPPEVCRRLPHRWLDFEPRLRPAARPWALYRVFGGRPVQAC